MDTITPFLLVCLLPMISHTVVFFLGRWSKEFTVQRRGQPMVNAYYNQDEYQQ